MKKEFGWGKLCSVKPPGASEKSSYQGCEGVVWWMEGGKGAVVRFQSVCWWRLMFCCLSRDGRVCLSPQWLLVCI